MEKESIRLESDQLLLRTVTLSDCSPRYLQWLNDPMVNRYLETRFQEQSLASIREFVQAMYQNPHQFLLAIVEKGSSRHIGNIKLGPVNPFHRHADVSYFIGERDCWGKGYATAAIRRVCAFGFSDVGLHRIQAGVYERNLGSIRALEKAGFTREGQMRLQLESDEGWQNHVFFGLLKEEFSR